MRSTGHRDGDEKHEAGRWRPVFHLPVWVQRGGPQTLHRLKEDNPPRSSSRPNGKLRHMYGMSWTWSHPSSAEGNLSGRLFAPTKRPRAHDLTDEHRTNRRTNEQWARRENVGAVELSAMISGSCDPDPEEREEGRRSERRGGGNSC